METQNSKQLFTWKSAFSGMGTQILLLKGTGWLVFFVVLFMHVETGGLDLTVINSKINSNLPFINKVFKQQAPESIGDCHDSFVPQPCQTSSRRPYRPLFYARTASVEFTASWISGVRSAHFDSTILSAPGNGRLTLHVRGHTGPLDLNFRVGECLTVDTWLSRNCDIIFSSAHDCTIDGSNEFVIAISADCHPEQPYLRSLRVDSVSLSPLIVSADLDRFGLTIDVSDITKSVENHMMRVIAPIVTQRSINWRGERATVQDFVNHIIQLNVGPHNKLKCPSHSEQPKEQHFRSVQVPFLPRSNLHMNESDSVLRMLQ